MTESPKVYKNVTERPKVNVNVTERPKANTDVTESLKVNVIVTESPKANVNVTLSHWFGRMRETASYNQEASPHLSTSLSFRSLWTQTLPPVVPADRPPRSLRY